MPRIRTVKPELAAHEGMYDLEVDTGLPMRFAWVMLFTACDREGRFPWRPRTLKAGILPHDDVDFSRVLDAWLTRGFVVKYRVGDAWFGSIPTWRKHQVINNRESASDIPDSTQADELIQQAFQPDANASGTRDARDDDASGTRDQSRKAERKGREGKEGKGIRKSGSDFSDAELMDRFALIRAAYPAFTAGQDWLKAEHHWRCLLDDAPHPDYAETLLAAVERYAAYVAAGGVSLSLIHI